MNRISCVLAALNLRPCSLAKSMDVMRAISVMRVMRANCAMRLVRVLRVMDVMRVLS